MLGSMFGKMFSGTTLKARALKGGVLALSGFGAAQGIRLVSNLIMTRLLAPDAFGLMGVTLALQIWIAMMSDLGLNASIIRAKRGDDPEFLATARLLQLGRCALIAVVLTLAAFALPGLAADGVLPQRSVYADPRLPVFLHAVALSVLISGFSAMRVALHNRTLDLAPVIRLELGAQIVALAAMAGAAFAGLGVYSLAFGAIVAEIVKSAGSHIVLKGPPARFGFKREHFDEIFGYGKWLLIASTFGYLVQRGDQILFGWLFDLGAFSLYAIATIWILTARTLVETVQRRIAYPALAELHRERPHDLTRIYRRMRLVYEVGCLALFAAIALLADYAVAVLYTDAYHGVAHFMKLLSVTLLLIPYRLLSSVFLTGGDSRRFTFITVLPGAALFGATPFIYHWRGADAAIVFAALTPILAVPFNWKFASKFIKIDYLRESAMAAVAIVAGVLLLIFA
jgi:O-antigen/teichoic acid export membrane protein